MENRIKRNKITLSCTQKQLDEHKYYVSEINGYDMSGKMNYCFYCKNKDENCICKLNQEERVKKTICAKEYRKLLESKND